MCSIAHRYHLHTWKPIGQCCLGWQRSEVKGHLRSFPVPGKMESNEHTELYLSIWRNEQDYHRIKGAYTGGSPWVVDAGGPGVLRVGGGGVWYPSWTGEEDAGSPWVVDCWWSRSSQGWRGWSLISRLNWWGRCWQSLSGRCWWSRSSQGWRGWSLISQLNWWGRCWQSLSGRCWWSRSSQGWRGWSLIFQLNWWGRCWQSLSGRCWWSRSSQGWRGGVWYPSWTGEEDAGSPWVLDADGPGVLRVGGVEFDIPAELVRKMLAVLEW